MQKKVKISAVKRAAHLKSKKTPLTKQQQHKLAQQKAAKEKKQNIFMQKARKKDNLAQKKKQNKRESLGYLPLDAAGSDDDGDGDQLLDNVADMLDGEDLEYLEAKRGGSQSKRKRKTEIEEEVILEKSYATASVKEKETQKIKVNLLPIKSRDGEIITRTTEVDYKPKPKQAKVQQEQDEEANEEEDEECVYEDSDDDIVQDEETALPSVVASKKLISTADLLIARQQEIERQKYRIGIICSGILEKPEDKMRNFNALYELMDETTGTGAPNLLTIRKLAMVSITELFKDILPEYRVGQIDTKMQTGKLN